jgi:hypothetical protein
MAQPFVLFPIGRRHPLRVTKPAADETAGIHRPQPLPRAAEQTENRATIVATKIDGTIEAFAAQRADDWLGLFEAVAATLARHRPDAI